MRLIWIGKYQSDIAYTKYYFSGSITYYGNGQGGNVFCCNQNNRTYSKNFFISFIIKNIKNSLGSCNYVFYNQSYAHEVANIFPECQSYIININSKSLINWLSNKTLVRLWVNNIVKVPPFSAVTGSECSHANLKSIFPNCNKYVVQNNYSSGGIGSFIIEKEEKADFKLNPCEIYLASPFLENCYSVNLHMIIGQKEQLVFPISIQIIEPNKSPFIFRGSDFITAQNMPKYIVDNINNCAYKIGEKLAAMGYRGICGIDFIVQDQDVYFIEINPRFQGSSFLINRALMERDLPSLYELNDAAFHDNLLFSQKIELKSLEVNYSYFKLKADKMRSPQNVQEYLNCPDIETYFLDGLTINESPSVGYIFRFISTRNLISINPNNQINIYQNLLNNPELSIPAESAEDWMILKTLLQLQGVVIDNSARNAIECLGGIQAGTFDAIDLYFSNQLVVNCPLKLPFYNFSPFKLIFNDKFELYYYEAKIDNISIDKKDSMPSQRTHSGLFYSQMVQRNNNRIRIRHNSVCFFKQDGKGCCFCHAKNEKIYYYDMADIEESFLYFLNNTIFDQIMIGGASNNREYEAEIIKEILLLIRKHTDKPIYIMTIPPKDLEVIADYKKLGANEIAFNIEIYDEEIAKKYMPGKGAISRNEYMQALEKAVSIFGQNGQVRSMLIVGLEPLSSFKVGVESLCQIGVSPMISPFRPMEKTKLQNFVPPDYLECQRYYEAALEITKKYNITLGPKNIYSQNNTFNSILNI